MSTRTNLAPRKPIQPFVPVRSDERTELYSHEELRALSSADPRNELDELSEPHRFKKEVKKPRACFEPEARGPRGGGLLLGFLAGAAAGAVLVALTTPRTGPELRGDLKDLARRAKREIPDQASQPTNPRTN